jgi:hypothetical protein
MAMSDRDHGNSQGIMVYSSTQGPERTESIAQPGCRTKHGSSRLSVNKRCKLAMSDRDRCNSHNHTESLFLTTTKIKKGGWP